jgi:DNA invertase Pin-like site-specific DNA recombinase
MDARPALIGLVRVSTEKQEASGLGLDAQLAALEAHRLRIDGDLIETYREVESGTHSDIDSRPKLREAVDHALEADGTLLIAKLDRLVRSTSVMEYLKRARVKFVACDNPHANELTIDILVAVAANEARMISQRTRDALLAYREGKRVSRRVKALYPGGVPADVVLATAGKLGASLPQCRNLTEGGRAVGLARSAESRAARATKAATTILRLIRAIEATDPGLSLEGIARVLNDRKRRTPRGKAWTGKQVARAIRRAGP